MLKRKPHTKQSYRTELTKLLHFQNQTSLQVHIEWTNPHKAVCKDITDQHYCFCGHFLSQHVCNNQQSIDKCTAQRCKCQQFYFVPDLNLKCICKHAPFRHEMGSKKCKQCVNCIGFITDWLCECGYRFEQHSTKVYVQKERKNTGCVVEKESKGKQMNASVSLPKLKNKLDVSYPKHDKIKEPMSVSLVRLKVDQSFLKENGSAEDQQDAQLKQKLREANRRYFAKFKDFATLKAETVDAEQKYHQTNAMDLYIQPHNFRSFALSKHISNILTHRQH